MSASRIAVPMLDRDPVTSTGRRLGRFTPSPRKSTDRRRSDGRLVSSPPNKWAKARAKEDLPVPKSPVNRQARCAERGASPPASRSKPVFADGVRTYPFRASGSRKSRSRCADRIKWFLTWNSSAILVFSMGRPPRKSRGVGRGCRSFLGRVAEVPPTRGSGKCRSTRFRWLRDGVEHPTRKA